MNQKKQVLIVLNYITDNELVQIQNSFNQGSGKKANISLRLIYVIPRLPISVFMLPAMRSMILAYHEEAERTLRYAGEQLNVAKQDQWFLLGNVRTESLRLAHTLDANLVLVGAAMQKDLKRSLFFKDIQTYLHAPPVYETA